MTRHRYDRQGMLAIEPKAFLWEFMAPDPTNDSFGDVAVVSICGPLDHHPGWWCDSYDAIRERVKAACGLGASTIVLKIDSPGGDVSGCFESAREIRKMCAAAGKYLLAYVDGQACSGAYALACAAEKIIVPDTGFVGSIGVINTRVDVSQSDALQGIRFAITTSGARKSDGHPHTPVSEGESAATQTIVDSLAAVFFDLVEELRGTPAGQIAKLQAGVFHGQAAVEAGLADQVMSFDELIEAIQTGALGAQETITMATKYEEGRAALEEAAKGEGAEAEKAKRALAAMDGDEKCEDKESPEDDEAESDEPPKDDEKEPESESARALATKALAKVNELAAENKRRERVEVREYLQSCKWLTQEARDLLKGETLAKAKAFAQSVKPKTPTPAASAQVMGTRGAAQASADGVGDRVVHLPPAEKAELDRKMGLVQTERVVVNDGAVQTFGALKVKGV